MAKVGRPTKYRPELCERAVQLARDGHGRLALCAELDIAPHTLLSWEKEHPEFLQATTRAKALSQAWWEEQGRLGIWSKDFNSSAYSLQVRNRFPDDWRDKQDHDVRTPDGIQVTVTRSVVGASNRIAHQLNGNGANGHP